MGLEASRPVQPPTDTTSLAFQVGIPKRRKPYVMFVGDTCGKTSLLQTWAFGSADEHTVHLAGHHIVIKPGACFSAVDTSFTICEGKRSTPAAELQRLASDAVLLYAIDSPASLHRMQTKYADFARSKGLRVLAVIATRTDRAVCTDPEAAKEFAAQLGVPMFATSSNSGEGVSEAMGYIARSEMLSRAVRGAARASSGLAASAVRAASSVAAVGSPVGVAASADVPSWGRNLSGQGAKGKVVLLYSGGLDTSCILLWLLEQGYDVHAYVANLGQDEDYEAAREKALKIGAAGVHIEDMREDFLQNYIYPSIQCNGIYENLYLLGTSIARPCISKRAVEIAKREGCDFVSHGATGKGNDQVRFELSMYALAPHLQMIVPWRDPAFFERFQGRSDLIEYAEANGLPVVQTKAKPYSMDENMFHISYEAGVLEDPANPPPEDMYRMTTNPEDAPDAAEYLAVTFDQGIPTRVENLTDGHERTVDDQLEAFLYLNEVAGRHGVGRADVVENRFVGIKSRGVYETPAGEVLRTAHIGLEGLTLDREVFRLRDMMAGKFAEYCYNGFWFSPEMDFVLKANKEAQKNVTGRVTVKLFKGRASIHARESPVSLYDEKIVSMDIAGGYNPADAEGFIRINAIRLKAHAAREKALGRTL